MAAADPAGAWPAQLQAHTQYNYGARQNPPVTAAGLRTAAELGFRVVKEDVVWSRWLQVSDRTIRFPACSARQVPRLAS